MNLSKHFTLKEMIASATAASKGVANIPNNEEIENIKKTCAQMEVVRQLLGSNAVQVLSCFRSEVVNKLVGGSKTSAHRYGLAVDFRCPSFGNTRQIAEALVKAQKQGLIQFDQLILEFPENGMASWVHVGWSKGKPRGQILTAKKQGGKTVYLQGLV